AQLGDALLDVAVLVLDALPFERGECSETQLEDCERLLLRELELRHEAGLRRFGVCGRANELDDRVEIVECNQVAGEDVRAAFLLAQLVLRTTRDDLALEVDEVRNEL